MLIALVKEPTNALSSINFVKLYHDFPTVSSLALIEQKAFAITSMKLFHE